VIVRQEQAAARSWPRSLLAPWAALLLLAGCGGQGGTALTSPSGATVVDNVLPVQVTSGPVNNTVNGLYATLTICVPGTSNCQTIDQVEVDTGSMGLRLLSSVVGLSLAAVRDASGRPVANCASYADMSYSWGSVVTADVELAGEKAASVPIQLIGAPGLPGAPSACSNGGTPADTVSALSAHGLLGLGVFRQDCGPACSGGVSPPPPVYFSCSGSTCAATAVALQNQLQNPVWLFPQDNNGLLVSLPAVPASGAATASGSVIFGIGTRANNSLGAAEVYTTDAQGNFSTAFAGSVYSSSYLDSGSNGLYFLDDSTIGLPPCPGEDSGWSCPPSTVNYTATNTGSNGTSGPVPFSVANAEDLFGTGNTALPTLGGPDTGQFDWGLPFFLGRTVFIAIEGQRAGPVVGPFWAY
jgi:hypothetical protein